VQLGLINTAGTSNKALVVQQKDKSKNPKKQHPHHNNKQNKGPKPSQPTSLLMVTKEKNLKIRRLTDIATFVGKMVMMSPNVLRRWKL
jgi:hypothetical protein